MDGARALVEASLSQGGDLLAQRVTVLAATGDPESVNLVGVFQATRSGRWIIGGLSVEPPQQTAQPPEVGSLLAVEAERLDNVLVLTRFTVIQGPQDAELIKMRGTIGNIGNTTWSLEIGQVRVSSATVSGKPIQGARVIVWGDKGNDGVFQVVYAQVLDERSVSSATQSAP